MSLLSIKNLSVEVGYKKIINELNLEIKPGEIHAIMGPNGSGKSTLAMTLAGHPFYKISQGEIFWLGEDLQLMKPETRLLNGIFLAFQYPREIPGVSFISFLRVCYNNVNKLRAEQLGKEFVPISLYAFKSLLLAKMKSIDFPAHFMNRAINEGFSGGEKKKSEIIQMALFEPKLTILDEIDSGVDIDALRLIGGVIQGFKKSDRSLLIITHYPRILNYIQPDYVHVMMNGKIVLTGDYKLAKILEKKGYAYVAGGKAQANVNGKAGLKLLTNFS
ncbi:TPA: Fe-S cluster assembly ATPase SufC [Candidatus Peregrinibacteria bacterium]|nr:Fe-S cluster assembly ATPase SufC [Candidatus Peregrinibacteria bacterium]